MESFLAESAEKVLKSLQVHVLLREMRVVVAARRLNHTLLGCCDLASLNCNSLLHELEQILLEIEAALLCDASSYHVWTHRSSTKSTAWISTSRPVDGLASNHSFPVAPINASHDIYGMNISHTYTMTNQYCLAVTIVSLVNKC
eukprot:6192823-Pleurochrysis_carterae.AAC.1